MLLTVDVGNTMTHYGLFSGNRLVKHQYLKTSYVQGEALHSIAVQGFALHMSGAVVCSVVPEVVPIFNVPTLIVNHKLDLGLKIRYKNPGKVGTDRLADAVAAKFIYGYPAFVIDFGTAITIDAISKEGDYLGGIILPGIDMIRYGLKEKTALLPLVPAGRPKKILGQTTKDAIQSGMYYGARGMIKQLIISLKKELRFSKKTVIINTGGYAEFLANGKVDQFLTLKGLKIIYERNRDNRSAFVCK